MNRTLTVYSKNQCPYCVQVKNFLTLHGVQYEEINIEDDTAAREFLLSQSHKSVPQIYLGDKLFIHGGWAGINKLSHQELHDKINSFAQ